MSLRYNLAGYRPSKTARQTHSSNAFSALLSKLHISQRVVLQDCLAAPTYSRQSKNMKAMSTCSKAPRGLFVHVEVGRVFTAIAISPSKPSRQLLARYAIHAGQNSPGKELRYLRTVIVTAAVHRSFMSEQSRRCGTTPLLNLPALDKRQPVYISFRFSTDLCFC